MSAPVDVLAVMSRDAELALNWNGRAKESSWNYFRESQEACAAVADLVKEATTLLEDARFEGGQWVINDLKAKALNDALARIGGATQPLTESQQAREANLRG